MSETVEETASPTAAPGCPLTVQALQQQALQAFEYMVGHTPGFRVREGQHHMAEAVAQALSSGDLGEHPQPRRALAVVQAGTGVGKSAAYASTAITLALLRNTRVLISTATVALQEQLMHKDLPALAANMPTPFRYALAKGRGRYVCKLKLERFAGWGGSADELFEDLPAAPARTPGQEDPMERRFKLYESLASKLATNAWDGDRDNLALQPEGADWAPIAAERHSCTTRQCPRFRDCSYYQARANLAQAQVIVVNHDLVLASLGMKTLPDLDKCLLVFDEGHHLPAVALDQFSSAMDLSNLRWLDKLPKTMQEVAMRLQLVVGEDVATLCTQLKAVLTQLARMAMELVWEHTGRNAHGQGQDGRWRLAHGVLPTELVEPVTQVHAQAQGLRKVLQNLGLQAKALAKEDPGMAALCAQQYARLGALAPRVDSLESTAGLLLEHGEQPLAKWLSVDSGGDFLTVTAHACPIVPGDLLRQFLWSQVRAAVVTSASLTSCGSFDYFLREAGLMGADWVQTRAVDSPFDYRTQGSLTVVHTQAEPRDAQAYTEEMVRVLLRDIAAVRRGALVLFTSKAQMRAATEALPATLRERVLVQGTQSRTKLLAAHTARVEAGNPSVLFGLQSFGEGLDLPGALCETVFIAKLPFGSPTDPVDEARAEWLRRIGTDPFNALAVPAAGIKLLQWSGRAIRTEDDRAEVVCYDKRLTQTAYGRRMLQGLPPYPVQRRNSRGEDAPGAA
ncbi:MAG: ATP-dependent DNA helicase DinG [Rhodoferax sp.]